MRPWKLSALVVLISLVLVSPTWAESITLPNLWEFTTARADLTWTLESSGDEQTVTGVFISQPPAGFQFIHADQSQRITQQYYLGSIQRNSRADYYYEPHQLFSLFSDFYFPLVAQREFEGEHLGDGLEHSRGVEKYRLSSDSQLEYWFEQETTLPWRIITEDGDDFLTTNNYQLGEFGEIARVEWDLDAQDYHAKIVLLRQGDSWFPQSIEIHDEVVTIRAEYEDWGILDTPIDLGVLPRLHGLLLQGSLAYDDEDWATLFSVYYEIGEIDPYYLPSYFYRGYGYGIIGNYLGAIENYQQWLMMQPQNPLALNNLAYTYMLQEIRLDEALSLAKRAVKAQNHPAYLDTVGYGYYLVGKYEPALNYLYQALEEIDQDMRPEVLDHLIKVYEALGDQENVTYYQEQLEHE